MHKLSYGIFPMRGNKNRLLWPRPCQAPAGLLPGGGRLSHCHLKGHQENSATKDSDDMAKIRKITTPSSSSSSKVSTGVSKERKLLLPGQSDNKFKS